MCNDGGHARRHNTISVTIKRYHVAQRLHTRRFCLVTVVAKKSALELALLRYMCVKAEKHVNTKFFIVFVINQSYFVKFISMTAIFHCRYHGKYKNSIVNYNQTWALAQTKLLRKYIRNV